VDVGEPFSLLIGLIVLCLVAYVLWWALNQIPLPQPIRTVVTVVFVLIIVVYIVQRFGLL